MEIKDREDKMLFKKFCFKSFLKKIFFMPKKINLKFFLLKFSPFFASQEFYNKSTLKSWFGAGEAKGSHVERPKNDIFLKIAFFGPLKSKF